LLKIQNYDEKDKCKDVADVADVAGVAGVARNERDRSKLRIAWSSITSPYGCNHIESSSSAR